MMIMTSKHICLQTDWCMPNKWTSKMPPVKKLLDEEVSGFVVEPFTGMSEYGTITNDISGNSEAFLNHDAIEFLQLTASECADTVILDWPYSPEQVSRAYKLADTKVTQLMTSAKWWADIKDQVARILKIGGKAIVFGWNSNGMGESRGFVQKRGLSLKHGGMHHNTVVVVDVKERHVDMPDPQQRFRGTYRPDQDKRFIEEMGRCFSCFKIKSRCACT